MDTATAAEITKVNRRIDALRTVILSCQDEVIQLKRLIQETARTQPND